MLTMKNIYIQKTNGMVGVSLPGAYRELLSANSVSQDTYHITAQLDYNGEPFSSLYGGGSLPGSFLCLAS